MVSAVKEEGQNKPFTVRYLLGNPYLSLVSRLVLGGVFLYAGASKVLDPGGLRPLYGPIAPRTPRLFRA
jgi:fructose-1,6-bisphosphatase